MYSAIKMTGKLYVMETSFDDFTELAYDSGELERCREHLENGNPVIFFHEIEDLKRLVDNDTPIVIIE